MTNDRTLLGMQMFYWLFKFSKRFQQHRWVLLIDKSGLFDRLYYLTSNPDVKLAGIDPLNHYILHGASEGRDPNPLFDTSYYLAQNPDVAISGINPLVHYILYGASEGRMPNPLFDTFYYLEQNPALATAEINPLAHYLKFGSKEKHNPSAFFNTVRYLESYPEVAKSVLNPLVHYLLCRQKEEQVTPSITRENSEVYADGVDSENYKHRTIKRLDWIFLLLRKLKDSLSEIGWRMQKKIGRKIARKTRASATSMISDRRQKNAIVSDITCLQEQANLAEKTTFSVVIPVKDGGCDLRLLLAMLKKQQGFKAIEIIVIDSGSTDGSLEFAREFGAKTFQILPTEFSHSYARNKGAEQASGDYLLFTVQDALPPNEDWLLECFCMMQANGTVAASCTEFMREDADLFYRIMSWNHNRFMEVETGDRILRQPQEKTYHSLRKNAQISNIACLIGRELFLRYKFKQNYAEDLDLGLRLIEDGHQLLLLRSIPIIHSHNRSVYYHLKRGYVDGLYMAKIFPSEEFVPTIDPKHLFCEILYVFSVLNHIVARALETLELPCTTAQLAHKVLQELQKVVRVHYPTDIDISDTPYIDRQFREFIDKVYHRYYLNLCDNLPYNGILLSAWGHFFKNIVAEYMAQTYEVIDAQILEGFQIFLYKIFAFQSGSQLANSYLKSASNVKENLKDIHAELTKGV